MPARLKTLVQLPELLLMQPWLMQLWLMQLLLKWLKMW